MTKCETAICQLAVNVYGKTSQCTVCMEEMAELTKELSKNLRGQDNTAHIAEEIADVEIMLEQLKLMFSIRDEVTQQRTVKLQRLDNRISQSLIHPKP
jgi:NTP pyrophosphatase (non-canonical NTP hydrolase)